MSLPVVDLFVARLQRFEQAGDPHELALLFTDKAELTNLTRLHLLSGASSSVVAGEQNESPDEFWSRYLRAFGRIQSTFTRIWSDEERAILEWTSDGTLPSGLPIKYNGVSLLDIEGDRIKSFRTYYDSAAFL